MKQIDFVWDGGADMVVMSEFVNKRLKQIQARGFDIIDIKSFGSSTVTMKTGSITYDIDAGGRIEDTSLFEGLVIGIIYDDNQPWFSIEPLPSQESAPQ